MFWKPVSNGHTRVARHVLRVFRGLSVGLGAGVVLGWVQVSEKDGIQREGLANIWRGVELELQRLQWNYFDRVSVKRKKTRFLKSSFISVKIYSCPRESTRERNIYIPNGRLNHVINIFLSSRHADGSIKFWDASAGTLQVLYKLKTAKLFEKGRTRSLDSEEDPLAIQLIFLCPESRKLAIAGSGRHVVLFKFKKVESMSEVVVSN